MALSLKHYTTLQGEFDPSNELVPLYKSHTKFSKFHVNKFAKVEFKWVHFMKCSFANEQIQAEIFKIIRNNNCHVLHFTQVHTTAASLYNLLTNYNSNLRAILLIQCSLTDDHIEALTWGALCTNIHALALENNPRIGLLGIQHVCRNFTGLVELNINKLNLSQIECRYLIQNIQIGIQHLRMSHNNLGQDNFELLCDKMVEMQLITLVISHTSVLNLNPLAVHLIGNSSLRCLDISSNPARNFTEFIDSLLVNTRLIDVDLRRIPMRVPDLERLLQREYILTHPNLCDIVFTGTGMPPQLKQSVRLSFYRKKELRVRQLLAICSSKQKRITKCAVSKLDINLIRLLASFLIAHYI